MYSDLCPLPLKSGTKEQPKEKVFGLDVPDVPGSIWNNKDLGADIHDPNASMTPGGCKKLGADSLFPYKWIQVFAGGQIQETYPCSPANYLCIGFLRVIKARAREHWGGGAKKRRGAKPHEETPR